MKISLLKLGYVLIFCTVFVAFYAFNEQSEVVNDNKTESPYDRMGRLHNEGLDYVLEKIVTTASLTKSGGREVPGMDEIRRMCEDFARSKGYRVDTRNGRKEGVLMEDFSFLTEIQQEWLRQIKEVVHAATPDKTEELVMNIKTLEQKLRQDTTVSAREKKILFYTMAISRYSAQYWAENYEKWQVEVYGMAKVTTHSVKTKREEGKYVSKEWWETYKEIVWADGFSGVQTEDGYYLENATAGSIQAYLP